VSSAPLATFSPLTKNISVQMEQPFVSYLLEYMAAVPLKMQGK